MDPRTAAAALTRIAELLELRGDNPFKTRAYHNAARALAGLDADDLGPPLRDGSLEAVPGLGPGTLAVVRDLVETGESRLLAELSAEVPPGLVELLRVPGLGTAKIRQVHDALGVDSLAALEAAVADGRLAALKGFGPKTAEKVARGAAFVRASGDRTLFPRAAAEAARLLADVRAQPGVVRADVAGSLRRRLEVVGDVDVVAATDGAPAAVVDAVGRAPGVADAHPLGARSADAAAVRVRFADGVRMDVYGVTPPRYAVALWRATGSAAHVAQVAERLAARGYHLDGDVVRNGVRDAAGDPVPVEDEAALYALAGMAFVVPELREGFGEVALAAAHAIPELVEPADILGAIHCHTTYSDGAASVGEMAEAARARGWRYIGITDHSQAASYAGGLSPAAVRQQHGEIDRVNDDYARRGVAFRVLKGIEADILADGALDYDDATLALFDYVIGSVHSRFNLGEAEMTARVCRAVANPFLTVLGHPTGRLLLQREAYAVDMHAVLAAAAEHGAAVELNADPHRLDLDWRLGVEARRLGLTIEIGPDAHAPGGLDNMEFGVAAARKAGFGPHAVLNARPADAVLAFARAKREGRAGVTPTGRAHA